MTKIINTIWKDEEFKMDNKFTETLELVLEAEKAVKALEDRWQPEVVAKGESILGQVVNYIHQVLNEARFVCSEVQCWRDIWLMPKPDETFVLYVGDGSSLTGCMTPVAIFRRLAFKYTGNKLNESQMLTLVRNWGSFKQMIPSSAKRAVERKQQEINKKVTHIASVQSELDGFKI